MEDLTAIDALRAEVAALRVVIERILGNLVADDVKPRTLLESELGKACSDMMDVALTDIFDQPSLSMQNQALHTLYQVYSSQVFRPNFQRLNS